MSQIDELREILVGGNAQEIAELRERLENLDQRTRDVAEVLAPAIGEGISKDDQLIEAFKAPVSQSLKSAIRTEPDSYAEILYPVMAPAIRRSISQAISSMLVTINQTIASATSKEGLQLRFEAWRTGVPYGQLALRRSLIYRVEHIYLIDRESGMMVTEYTKAETSILDSDAVSAMFTAIQSFVQDSFSQSEDDRLTDLKVGEYNVWVAHGSKLMLAAVIDGDPPESLKFEMYDVLDGIQSDYAQQIADFDGDNEAFGEVSGRLEPLLQLRAREEPDAEADGAQSQDEPQTPGTRKVLLIAAAAIIALVALYFWAVAANQRLVTETMLAQTPGLAISNVSWEGDKLRVEGLRDPDAEIPFAKLAAHGVTEADLEFATVPFRSLQPAMEMTRLQGELQPPSSLTMHPLEGRISVAGTAPVTWLMQHDARLRQLAMEKRIDYSQLHADTATVLDYIIANYSQALPARQSELLAQLGHQPWHKVPAKTVLQLK